MEPNQRHEDITGFAENEAPWTLEVFAAVN
jgi:hypothetical protein